MLIVAYLHGQAKCIIHRDIKPANVLVNFHLLAKLCDLGYSKYTAIVDSLQTDKGNFCKWKGTKPYLSPEILLPPYSEANTATDIWTLASTFTEMYNEQFVWDMTDYEDIESIFNKKQTPDLNKVPEKIQGIIKKCFSYIPLERPSALDIAKKFE